MCKYYSRCEVDTNNRARCVCPEQKCPKTREPVCGDDGQTYDSLCNLRAESCTKERPIKMKNKGVCGRNLVGFSVISLHVLHYIASRI